MSKTLLSLINPPSRVNLTTPEELVALGMPESSWIDVLDAEDSLEFSLLQVEIMLMSGKENVQLSLKDDTELTAKMLASLVKSWDESYFGPFSKEALLTVLTTPRFYFVNVALYTHRQERAELFSKA